MSLKQLFFFLGVIVLSFSNGYGQRVGVVLSGGGVAGYAHIGMLQALEEEEVPIDYIVGTSSGSLIGGLYAVGYSPQEIKVIFLSSALNGMTSAQPSKAERFLLREKKVNPSLLNVRFSFDSILRRFLPTNFLIPARLDYETFVHLGVPGAAYNGDFDSLFIPFRCVATDAYHDSSVVFKEGNLNKAVRASMTFPFYLNPIRVNGNLLYDGGLYNNFPSDVLCESFPVDFVIGSNVSSGKNPPEEGSLLSQVTSLLTEQSSFSIPCDGMIINSAQSIGTFEFSKAEEAYQIGYNKTKKYIDSIRQQVHRRVSIKEREKRRTVFRSKIKPLMITEVKVQSFKPTNLTYIKNNFTKDSLTKPITIGQFKKRYFRTYASPQVKYLYPTLSLNQDSTYQLSVDVTKQRPFEISIGGILSSQSINTAYVGLSYYDMGQGAIGLHGESYFGKFYASTAVQLDYDIPTLFPIRMSPYFVLNRWDYYRSNSTFFENDEPSFLLQNEMYYGLNIGIPATNNGKVSIEFRKFENKDQYYQSLNYTKTDTADITFFNGGTVLLNFEYNTLNRKQWASEGSSVKASFRYVQGKEKSLAGNTHQQDYDLRRFHQWISLSVEGQKYFTLSPFFKIGAYGHFVLNSKSLFSNYTASLFSLSAFSPLPDSRTLFMKEYRAPQFIGGGLNFVFSFKDFLELRVDGFFFQPFKQLIEHKNGEFGYSELFEGGTPMAGASVIFHSPFGPLRLSTNWFPHQEKQFLTQISFGYILFNDRSIRR